MIETRLLQYFLAIAEEQSITRAAEYLHVTQPTLSKQMMELEANLGKQLLIRGKKKVTLTEDGAYLRNRAQEIISLMEKTEESFRESEEIIAGEIYIGCGELYSLYPIIQMMKEISEEYPEIRFHFFSGNADSITEKLDKGLLDLGFLLEPEISPRYEYVKLPFHERFGVLMRKDSPLAAKDSVTPKDIADLPLIVPSQNYSSSRTKALFADHFPTPHIVASYNLIYNAGLMVDAGMGYALCIDNLINTEGNHPLTFVPISPETHSDVYLCTKKYQVFSKATKLLLDRIQERFVDANSKS